LKEVSKVGLVVRAGSVGGDDVSLRLDLTAIDEEGVAGVGAGVIGGLSVDLAGAAGAEAVGAGEVRLRLDLTGICAKVVVAKSPETKTEMSLLMMLFPFLDSHFSTAENRA
jgi:hypothetical protein